MTEKNIYSKLIEVQKELKAPKGQYNNFGRYNYRSAEDILEAVKPLLHKQGLLQVITDDVISVGERVYIKSTVSIYDSVSSIPDETISNSAFARESETKKGMDDSQITGTASSYARKYALNGLYAIDDTKDADSNEYNAQNGANSGSNARSQLSTPLIQRPTKNELLKLFNEVKTNGIDEATLKAEMLIRFADSDVKSTSDLTKSQYDELMAWAKGKGK